MGAALIQDAYATGTITHVLPNVPPGTITTWTKGSAERYDLSSGGDQQTYVANGGRSWSFRQGQRGKLPYALSAYHRPEHTPALTCTLDLANPQMSISYIGQELVRGRQLNHIKIFVPPAGGDYTDAMLSQLDIYLDPTSSLILKTERFVFDPKAFQNYSVWATYYSDYRSVNGVQMPFHIENYIDGQKLRDIVFTNVQVNVGVPDSQFQ